MREEGNCIFAMFLCSGVAYRLHIHIIPYPKMSTKYTCIVFDYQSDTREAALERIRVKRNAWRTIFFNFLWIFTLEEELEKSCYKKVANGPMRLYKSANTNFHLNYLVQYWKKLFYTWPKSKRFKMKIAYHQINCQCIRLRI